MVSKITLASNFLLASVALADPSSRLEARLARRRENRQSKPINRLKSSVGGISDAEYSSNSAGAVWAEPEGTFTTVTGTFLVPIPGGNGGASVWVGIDGDTCDTAMLQAGIDMTVSDGEVSYDAWYEWYPDYAYAFSGITISAGDVITANVTATSTTSGTVVIENLTTGQTVSQDIVSIYPLCEENAEWIFEDDDLVSITGFGNITFTDAIATGSSGSIYTPEGATIIEIEQSTSVTTGYGTITIKYV